MLNHPDPLPMQADIDAIVAETGLSLEIVERLYQHWIEVHGDVVTWGNTPC